LDDAEKVLKIAFRDEGDVILLLDGSEESGERRVASGDSSTGGTSMAAREFSSSEYAKTIAGIVAGEPPAIDLQAERRLIECLVALAGAGTLQSAHDLSDGGLAVALAESCFASKGLSANVTIEGEGNAELALFGEQGARAIVSVTAGNVGAVLATARQYGVGARRIGGVSKGSAFRIIFKGGAREDVVIYSSMEELKDTWANALQRNMGIS
jgi:phosphoribosylformylglycinamidine synthase